MKSIKSKVLIFISVFTLSCSDFLDIVPDNVATIEYAFRMRSTAERYLYTCYSYMVNEADPRVNVGLFGSDEFWIAGIYQASGRPTWEIAAGLQNTNNPILSPWYGSNGMKDMWEAISQCNIFLENIHKVPDMDVTEKQRWTAEVKFLKAYYHFVLLKHFGPIPVMRTNMPISASVEDVQVPREPVDVVFNYIVTLINEAAEYLPDFVLDETSEMGRITRPIALGVKAKVLVYAASPLFNGNIEYSNYTNTDGTQLFDQTYSPDKWQLAADACKVAIELAHELGYSIYEFQPSILSQNISDVSKTQMNHRGKLTERWNSEIIWANTSSTTRYLQTWTAPRGLSAAQQTYTGANGSYGASLNAAYRYYTKNGLPIDEDTTWDFNNRLTLRMSSADDKYEVKPGYVTVNLHFNREPRFYASLGFDGGIWYGNGKYNDADLYWLEMKSGQWLGKQEDGWHPYCGYFVKKYINYTNTATDRTTYNSTDWPWVMLRLSDLYLLYAEALNELNGPNTESLYYLNQIRTKVGIPDVETAWANFSTSPGKPTTKAGLREIIQDERTIEMAFEGERFWDLRRWKKAPIELNQTIIGWDTSQSAPENYYRERQIFKQSFTLKDYFWPIREYDYVVNKKLVQSPGW